MTWEAVPLDSVSLEKSPVDRIEGVYQSAYKGNYYRLYAKTVCRVRNPGWLDSSLLAMGDFRERDRDFRREIVLELIDQEGVSLFTFPEVIATSHLLATVRRQVADPDRVLASLFDE